MRNAVALVLCALALTPLAGGARAEQAADYAPPTISEIEATFVEQDRATRYAVEVSYDKDDGEPLFKWGLTPPADDPSCSKLLGAQQRGTIRDAGGGRLVARSTATWHHGDGDGCSHKGFEHNGWVDVLAYVHHKERYGEFNLQCSAQYFGTLTGSGESGGRQEATCDSAVPRPKKVPGRLTVDFKVKAEIEAAFHADLIDTYTVEGAAFGACAVAPIPATQIMCGLAAAASAYLVYLHTKEKEEWEKLVKDPPDPNFRVIAGPAPVRIPPLGPADGLTGSTAAAANALGSGTARMLSLGNALMTSINRQLGAHRAGDRKAQRLQERAAAGYARGVATAIEALAPLRVKLRAALAAQNVDLPVFPKDFADTQGKLRASGLPDKMVAILKKLGMTQTAIARLPQRATQRRPPGYVLVFPAMLANPGLARSEAAAAASLRRYARLLK